MAKKSFTFQERGLLDENKSQPDQVNIMPMVNTDTLREKAYEDAGVGLSYFTPENIPHDYSSLKKEIKFLAETHAKTFIILSHRLQKVRNEELYKIDGYPDFKSFVEVELDLSIRTVYNYLAVVDIFEVQPVASLKTTNLFLALPIVSKHPEFKDVIFNASQKMPKSEFKNFLGQYKEASKVEIKENLSTDITWYEKMDDLIANSKTKRKGLKRDTVKRDFKEDLNWLIIDDPKNKTLQKMRDLFTDL